MHESAASDTIDIRYGPSALRVPLPAAGRATVIRKPTLPKLSDPHAAVRAALARPVAATPHAELARGKRSACILICDVTRPVPNRLFLRPLIEDMLAAGIARERIT